MTFIKIYYLLHDLPYYAMICYYFLRYDLLWQPILQPTLLPPPPCTLTLTTVYKINCCTFLFNMSYSRIALKKIFSYFY